MINSEDVNYRTKNSQIEVLIDGRLFNMTIPSLLKRLERFDQCKSKGMKGIIKESQIVLDYILHEEDPMFYGEDVVTPLHKNYINVFLDWLHRIPKTPNYQEVYAIVKSLYLYMASSKRSKTEFVLDTRNKRGRSDKEVLRGVEIYYY